MEHSCNRLLVAGHLARAGRAVFVLATFLLVHTEVLADPITLPLSYRADTNAKIVNLKNYDALDPAMTSTEIFESPYGQAFFESTLDYVPANYTFWFMDSGDKQPAGFVTVIGNAGKYNNPAKAPLVFGTPTGNNPKLGVSINTNVDVVAEDTNQRFWASYFSPALTFTDWELPQPRNIFVTSTEITPEPATLAMLAAGATIALLRRRRAT